MRVAILGIGEVGSTLQPHFELCPMFLRENRILLSIGNIGDLSFSTESNSTAPRYTYWC